MNPRCWWFGCERHPQDPSPPEEDTCMHCSQSICYGDLVGDTRHRRFVDGLTCFYRMFIPRKCRDCGRRWRKCDDSVFHDDIPF